MEKKLKVVLICHFSNALIREHLPLDNRKLYTLVRRLLGLRQRGVYYKDVADWNTNFIDNFKIREDVELTVISAHPGLKKNVVSFSLEGVNYYFVRSDYATFLKHIINNPKIWLALNPMIPIVHKIVYNVNPDIVALMGAENAHISSTILGLEKDYPCIFKAQTIYNNPNRKNINIHNAYVERLVFNTLQYASVSTKMHYELYRNFCKNSFNFDWRFGRTFYPIEKVEEKEYDFVNFAMQMSISKGYIDSIKALAIVKKCHPDVKLNLIGASTSEFDMLCKNLVLELGLERNVFFTQSFVLQKDLFQHLQKSRFALLPYKLDYISSTTWQAMHYELPVICYKTMGTPTLNNDKECILIAEMDNIESLAKQMLILLENPIKADELKKNAKELVDMNNDEKNISDEIVRNFRAIVNHFNSGMPIPEDYLLNF